MLFQVLCGFEPIFYTTHPNEEPFLIGNYAMLIRHSWINVDGMDCSIGIPVTCVLIVFTVIAGFIRFKRFDIIQEEN